ncbi:MAG: KpsF/GutQ family sugar-phosphate isomerase [bacterium]
MKNEIANLLKFESDAISALIGRIEEPVIRAAEVCLECNGRVIVIGLGKSGIIGRKISATLASTGTSSFFVHAAEALHGDLGTITRHDCALMISKSGNTPEVLVLVPPLKRLGIKIVSITNNPHSELGAESDVVLATEVDESREPFGKVPTTSAVATLAVGDALAVALMMKRGFTQEDFAVFHPGGNIGHQLRRVSEVMHSGKTLPVVSSNASILDGIVAMSTGRLGHVIITEGKKLRGIFSDGDLRRLLQAHPHEDIVNLKLVEFATASPLTICPKAIVEEAVRLMEEKKITALPVIDEGELIGMVHLHDLLASKVV